MPPARFFVGRALTGAAVGVLLLFVASVCTTYESILDSSEWGARLRIALGAQMHGSVAQTLLTLCQVIAMALLAVCLLASAEQALLRALPAARRGRAGLAVLVLMLAACLAALNVLGFTPALFAAPLLAVPTAVLLILHKRMGGKIA